MTDSAVLSMEPHIEIGSLENAPVYLVFYQSTDPAGSARPKHPLGHENVHHVAPVALLGYISRVFHSYCFSMKKYFDNRDSRLDQPVVVRLDDDLGPGLPTEAELGVVTEIIEDLNARADAAISELDETIARIDRLRGKVAAFNAKSAMLGDGRAE